MDHPSHIRRSNLDIDSGVVGTGDDTESVCFVTPSTGHDLHNSHCSRWRHCSSIEHALLERLRLCPLPAVIGEVSSRVPFEVPVILRI